MKTLQMNTFRCKVLVTIVSGRKNVILRQTKIHNPSATKQQQRKPRLWCFFLYTTIVFLKIESLNILVNTFRIEHYYSLSKRQDDNHYHEVCSETDPNALKTEAFNFFPRQFASTR